MSEPFVDVNASDMVFRLWYRSIHPELYRSKRMRHMDMGLFSAEIHVAHRGHVIWFRPESGKTYTEALIPNGEPTPRLGCVTRWNLSRPGVWEAPMSPFDEIKYRQKITVMETATGEIYDQVEKMNLAPNDLNVLKYVYGSANVDAGGSSAVVFQCTDLSLGVRSFHGFPMERVVIESRSFFEVII